MIAYQKRIKSIITFAAFLWFVLIPLFSLQLLDENRPFNQQQLVMYLQLLYIATAVIVTIALMNSRHTKLCL